MQLNNGMSPSYGFNVRAMIGENRQLVVNEPVEFEI